MQDDDHWLVPMTAPISDIGSYLIPSFSVVANCDHFQGLESTFRWSWFGFIVQHCGAFRYMAGGSAFIEASVTMRALNVVGILRWGRRWQIGQLSTACQVRLHFFGRPDRSDKFLVLLTPITLFGVRLHNNTRDGLVGGSGSRRTALLRYITFSVRSLFEEE